METWICVLCANIHYSHNDISQSIMTLCELSYLWMCPKKLHAPNVSFIWRISIDRHMEAHKIDVDCLIYLKAPCLSFFSLPRWPPVHYNWLLYEQAFSLTFSKILTLCPSSQGLPAELYLQQICLTFRFFLATLRVKHCRVLMWQILPHPHCRPQDLIPSAFSELGAFCLCSCRKALNGVFPGACTQVCRFSAFL